jgi:hypothetical protein
MTTTNSITPTIAVLGAPGTGAEALAQALRAYLVANHPATTAVVHALPDNALQALLAPASPPSVAATLEPTDPRWTRAQLIVLMGLDPGAACSEAERQTQERSDQQLRMALCGAGKSFQVIYGTAEARLATALKAIIAIITLAKSIENTPTSGLFDSKPEVSAPRRPVLRAWNCEKCSDPECEHRLFTDLTRSRHSATMV